MTISLQYCNITVNDPAESIPFYRDGLGLEVRNDVANGGFHWITMGSPDQPELELVLSAPHAGRSQADGDQLQELLVKGVLPMLVFRTGDLDALFERLRLLRGGSPAGTDGPAVGSARLRRAGPIGQHDPDQRSQVIPPARRRPLTSRGERPTSCMY